MVVTGPTTGGTYGGGFLGFFSLEASTGGSTHETRLPSIDFRAPRRPTCSVSTPSVRMSLGTVSVKAFKGVGSNAGTTTENITLSCSGGEGSSRDVLITLTDQTQPANRTDVLSLTRASTASGVALQLLRGPTLIRYGADSSVIGNPNQWLAGSTGNGTFSIPLTARYIQTERDITAGTANGVATFTMAYR
ncbi:MULTISPECIES: fimbrial protein [unclassified Pseudomonas]|uniref:fimbrial protein n=1 Tax=unclassified Pseudomonas TaxID=196821 RepID=UPI00210D00F4|nr:MULTISPECIES: fimbrial protein [unclassified Pseudomonas]